MTCGCGGVVLREFGSRRWRGRRNQLSLSITLVQLSDGGVVVILCAGVLRSS